MTTVLVPPGMGDIYWVLTKLESFRKVENIDKLDMYIYCSDRDFARSLDYVKLYPSIVDSVNYVDLPMPNLKDDIFYDMYIGNPEKAISKDYMGFDYFMWFNGAVTRGLSPADVCKQYETNWYPEMIIPEEYIDYGEKIKTVYGNYMLASFSTRGHYAHWFNEDYGTYSFEKWYDVMLKMYDKTGSKFLLIGRHWDREDNERMLELDAENILHDFSEHTSVNQFFALIRSAQAFLGIQAGSTMMSAIFHKPTFILYNQNTFYLKTIRQDNPQNAYQVQIKPNFYDCTLPPDTMNGIFHIPIFVDRYDPTFIERKLNQLIEKGWIY